MYGLIVYLLFPLLCIQAIAPSNTRYNGSVAERVVYGIALYEFLSLIIGLTLGSMSQLQSTNYLLAVSGTIVFLGLRSWQNGFTISLKPVLRWIKTGRGLLTFAMVLLISMAYAFQLGVDAYYGTKHIDGLWYHIPRLIFWRQQGNFDAWITPYWPQIGLPVGADIVLGQKIFLGSGWLGIGYVSCVLTVGAITCVYIAALHFGFSRWNAIFSALLFSSFPVVGLRVWSANSDITAAFPLLASFVVIHRVRNINVGIAAFIVLNGMALACKQTIIFQAVLLACIVLWQLRHRFPQVKSFPLITAAFILSASLVFFSFLPVYKAFGDLDGGNGGRGHKVTSVKEFNHALAMCTAHWLLEPLGYLAPVPHLNPWVQSTSINVYNSVGAHFDQLPEKWRPWPAQDISRSGLVSIIFLPILLFGLPARVRIPAALIFLAGFIPLSGLLYSQPWFARYTITLLAGYALIWGGTKYFQHGNKRWLLIGIVAINMLSLCGVLLMRFYIDNTEKSQPGGPYYYLSDKDRHAIAKSLHGQPLQVIADDSLDALLVGPDISFTLKYIIFPVGCDWSGTLRHTGTSSNWLAVVHGGKQSILTGTEWDRPKGNLCREISITELETTLRDFGWQRYRQNPLVDLWKKL